MSPERREAHRLAMARYRAKYPDRELARSRKYREAHPEKGRVATAEFRKRHPERARDQNRVAAARGRRNHPEKKRALVRATSKKSRDRKRELIFAAKDQPCMDCNQRYPFYVMDLDHVRGEKICNVSLMVSLGWSEEEIIEEIAKCDVVCSNCHRERTHKARRNKDLL